jgi:predicted DNA-binding transcriptional regulator YafY
MEDGAMRADRLVATLLVLQARGRVTAAEVAAELEVSTRTARRDLEALAMAGVPVYSQAGKGGGWSLLGGSRTDLTGLTAAEARTLFLVAGPSAATPSVKSALRKLVRALPEPFRAEAEAAGSAVLIDPAGWDQPASASPEHLGPLQQAVIEGRQVVLGYATPDRTESERTVHPLGVVAKGAVWYLVADTAAGLRTFRVSRVRSVVLTDEPVVRPDGFDLAATWRGIVARLDETRHPVVVSGWAEPRTVSILRFTLGSRLAVGPPGPDGRLAVEIRGHHARSLAGELAGFAPELEVTAPEDVRTELKAIGEALVRHHPPT